MANEGRNRLMRAAAACYRFNYRLFSHRKTQDKIVFLSRQSDTPSLDFELLSKELAGQLPSWKIVMLCKRNGASSWSNFRQFLFSIRQSAHIATARACILEGYIPAISIPDLDEHLVVIQIWHAMGAIKKFGFQSVGTLDGRTSEAADVLCMHRNYSWIIAGGKGAISAYSEAFGYPREKIVALGMPHLDYLLKRHPEVDARFTQAYPQLASHKTCVLYAPTFHNSKTFAPFISNLARQFPEDRFTFIMSRHPLANTPLPSNVISIEGFPTIERLPFADYVITDYSAIAFDAAKLGKKILFYVPDIDSYRFSPGLNIDPMKTFPQTAFTEAEDLVAAIEKDVAPGSGDAEKTRSAAFAAQDRFMHDYLKGADSGASKRIAEFIIEKIEEQRQ